MSNFSEIINIKRNETIRKQLLEQIKLLEIEINTLEKKVKSSEQDFKGAEINNNHELLNFQEELKKLATKYATMLKYKELLDTGVDPETLDFYELKAEVEKNAKDQKDKFEDLLLGFKEMITNEGLVNVATRLVSRSFSPNLHFDYYKDEKSNEAQIRLNDTLDNRDTVAGIVNDIFPKTLQGLIESNDLSITQKESIGNLQKKYHQLTSSGHLTTQEYDNYLDMIKNDDDLKKIFLFSPDLKKTLNVILKEVICEIVSPEGKSVNQLKDIVIQMKSKIAYLNKLLETADKIKTDEDQKEVLDVNDKYFREIQTLKAEITKLNMEIKEKVQTFNTEKQKKFQEMKDRLERLVAKDVQDKKPEQESTAIMSIQAARAEIINNNFETEQNEYKEKLMKLPNLLFEHLSKHGKIGNLTISSLVKDRSNLNFIWTRGDKLNIYKNRIHVENKNNYNTSIELEVNQGIIKLQISENQFDTNNFDVGVYSYKEAFNRIKTILKRDFEIDVDNLECKSDLIETPPTILIENQETLTREKYKQIQDICNRLEQKAKAGEFGILQTAKFSIGDSMSYNFQTFDMFIPNKFASKFDVISLTSKYLKIKINPKLNFDSIYMSIGNIGKNKRVQSFETDSMGRELSDRYIQPTLKQLNSVYNELTNLIKESNIKW
jgi:hypothetical protein